MGMSILITSATEDSAEIKRWAEDRELTLMHLPLERYNAQASQQADEAFDKLNEYETIVYGNLRNAVFFLQQVRQRNLTGQVRERVNLTLHQTTAEYLDREGIPAICSFGDPEPINLVEFMLRLRRTGPVLYPCGAHTKEEIPGFLEELDISVDELVLFDLEGPTEEELESYRTALTVGQPDVVVFHSRRSVTRTRAAFPKLDYAGSTIISADTGVTEKLEKAGIGVTFEADGDWKSIIELVNERV